MAQSISKIFKALGSIILGVTPDPSSTLGDLYLKISVNPENWYKDSAISTAGQGTLEQQLLV